MSNSVRPHRRSPPGSTIPGILQARTLEWVAIAFSHFHVLAIVNSAAMNNGLHVSFSILVSSGYMPRSGDAGSYGGFIQFSKEISTLFSEKAMATHSSVLAWRIPGMVEPGGLPSMGSHRVGHD